MTDLGAIIDAKIHLGDLLVSGVGVALSFGMRLIIKAIKSFVAQAEKFQYVADTHTSVLARISGWRPSRSMYFDPDHKMDDQVFKEPTKGR